MGNPNEPITLVIMGATGAGKSTLINLISGSSLGVGHSLESCTTDVQVGKSFDLDGKVVTLIDTPGFDDTTKTEAEILRLIADFFAASYESGRKPNGIIFLHRISDYKVGGVARKNFRLFRKICGDDALSKVLIVTNMWGQVTLEVGADRERELANSELFFKPALEKGAQMVRHDNTVQSARSIVGHFMEYTPEALSIQKEVVDQRKSIAQTSAGLDIQAEIQTQISKHQKEMKEIEEDRKALLALKDEQHEEEIRELNDALKDIRSQLEKLDLSHQKLYDEHQGDRKEAEERAQKMVKEIAEREASVRTLQVRAQEQKHKIEKLHETLSTVQANASTQVQERQVLEQKVKAQETTHKKELHKARAELQRKMTMSAADQAEKTKEIKRKETEMRMLQDQAQEQTNRIDELAKALLTTEQKASVHQREKEALEKEAKAQAMLQKKKLQEVHDKLQQASSSAQEQQTKRATEKESELRKLQEHARQQQERVDELNRALSTAQKPEKVKPVQKHHPQQNKGPETLGSSETAEDIPQARSPSTQPTTTSPPLNPRPQTSQPPRSSGLWGFISGFIEYLFPPR